MSVYTIKRGDSLFAIATSKGVTMAALLAANPQYKANPNLIRVGDKLEIPAPGAGPSAGKRAGKKKARPKAKAKAKAKVKAKAKAKAAAGGAAAAQGDDDFTVPFGQLTFDAEGMEQPGRFFSRRLHVPSGSSGATIGRGYDMRERSQDEIVADLSAAGVPQATARRFSQCRGLRGQRARDFIAGNALDQLEITPAQQKALFLLTYQELEGDVVRICTKADVVAKYGETLWADLHPAMRDVVVDLRYRGDYTGTTRERVQPPLVRNDLAAFRRVLVDEAYWMGERGVPRDRFRRRRAYLESV